MSNQVGNAPIECKMDQQSDKELTEEELAEFYKTLSSFDMLPLFERQYDAFLRTRKYSLKNNEKLRERWHDRLWGKTVRGRTTLPKVTSDEHFHNCRIKLLASQSPANFPTLRRHLVPGPGVDKYGQRPIPADMMLRKTENKRSRSPAGISKNKDKTRVKQPVA
ncbi:uncharacterized protein LOC125225442 [Leguminivora glycinivorella]|uniref:uncharacterized protein LOC125225442 n=1 Tax=Leguminivora glycinivorella TaxID=1035111 RepID=UPI00200CF8FB|nr:uncharacterized protein LOC125225442 [Leguminivora glycinivorella]